MKEETMDVLPIEEADVNTLQESDYKSLYEQKSNALTMAEETNRTLRAQLGKQVEMYNKDVKHLSGIIANQSKYKNTKEDAVLKVLEGIIELIKLDKMDLIPSEKEDNNNGN